MSNVGMASAARCAEAMVGEILQFPADTGGVLLLGVERMAREAEKTSQQKESFLTALRAGTRALRSTRSLGAAASAWRGGAEYARAARAASRTERGLARLATRQTRVADAQRTIATAGGDASKMTAKFKGLQQDQARMQQRLGGYRERQQQLSMFGPQPKPARPAVGGQAATGATPPPLPQGTKGTAATGGTSGTQVAAAEAPPTEGWRSWVGRLQGAVKKRPIATAAGVGGGVGLLGGVAVGAQNHNNMAQQGAPYY